MTDKPTYRVYFEPKGWVYVEANSIVEAMDKASQMLRKQGIRGLIVAGIVEAIPKPSQDGTQDSI